MPGGNGTVRVRPVAKEKDERNVGAGRRGTSPVRHGGPGHVVRQGGGVLCGGVVGVTRQGHTEPVLRLGIGP